jgi:hypothetical protein
MKDYSAMSDFEINKAVAILVRPEIRGWDCHDISGRACFVINSNTSKRVQFGFSFTSDPADAWPIIDENNISIINDHPELRIATSSVNSLMNEIDSDCYFQAANEIGIRAAMEVYLMMKDAEKGHG